MNKLYRITKQRIKNHIQYGKWHYIAAIIAVVVIINLAYTISTPRYPNENKVSIIIYATIANEEVLDEWEKAMLKLLAEDQRKVEMTATVPIDISTQGVVVARIAAKEDDILVMDIEHIKSYVNKGAFLPLDENMNLDKIINMYPDVDWGQYSAKIEESEDAHIYWLPLCMVTGWGDLQMSGDDLGIAILSNSENVSNAVICLEYILTR